MFRVGHFLPQHELAGRVVPQHGVADAVEETSRQRQSILQRRLDALVAQVQEVGEEMVAHTHVVFNKHGDREEGAQIGRDCDLEHAREIEAKNRSTQLERGECNRFLRNS